MIDRNQFRPALTPGVGGVAEEEQRRRRKRRITIPEAEVEFGASFDFSRVPLGSIIEVEDGEDGVGPTLRALGVPATTEAQVETEIEAEVIGILEGEVPALPTVAPEGVPDLLEPEAPPITEDDITQAIQAIFPELLETEFIVLEEAEPAPPTPQRAIQRLEQRADEDTEGFLRTIFQAGQIPETELLLTGLFGLEPAEITEFFTPPPVPEIPADGLPFPMEASTGEIIAATVLPDLMVWFEDARIGSIDPETGLFIPISTTEAAKQNLALAWADYMERPEGIEREELRARDIKASGKVALQALGVAGAWIDRYIGRPFKTAVLEANARFWAKVPEETFAGTDRDRHAMAILEEARRKYGWLAAWASSDVDQAWEGYLEESSDLTRISLKVSEWLNPVYFIPIGGTFGLGARYTTRIPLLGRATRFMAAGVQGLERGIVFPVAKPLELTLRGTAKGAELVGRRIGKTIGDRFIQQTDHLLLEIGESQTRIDGALQSNWQRTVIQVASRIPPVKVGIEKGLGWRILVKRQGKAIEDIVGQGGVLHTDIARMGVNARAVKTWELQSISRDPVKLFGFDDMAVSQKMTDRLLPEFAAEKDIAGTLEHVFTKPEMYNWEGLERGLDYVTRVHEINTEVLNLLRKEGVAPANLSEDWWIHRVVTGKLDPNGELIKVRGALGRKSGGLGSKPSYEMQRKAPTMEEGISWGLRYSGQPEVSVGSFIQEAFKKIADARFVRYVEEHAAEFGVTPAERLLERFPQLVERATLTQTELKDAANFGSVINRAIRGEKIPEQTLRAMERRFPEMGARLRQGVTGKESPFSFGPVEDDLFGYPMPESLQGVTAESVRPTVEGIKELAAKADIKAVTIPAKTPKELLTDLRDEVKALTEARKAPFRVAKAEKAEQLALLRQPEIGESYIMQPFAGGKIYNQEFIDSFNKFFGHDPGSKVLQVTADVAGILRITKAALDFSIMAIQGMPSFGMAHTYLVKNPAVGLKFMGAWNKAFAYSIGGVLRPDFVAGYMARNRATALQRISFGGSSRSIDYFATLEARTGIAGITEKAFAKIPLKPYHRFEAGFFAGGEVLRNEAWKIFSPKALKQGKGHELARFLDRITGITDSATLGVPATVRQLEQSFVWFAPNYTRACLTVLADIFRGGMTGAMARDAIGGMVAAGAAYYTGVQYALATIAGKSHEEAFETVLQGFGVETDPITGETVWNPTARFMSIEVGNYNFGIGGFWYGLTRLLGNITATVAERGERERIDLVRIMQDGSFNKKDNPFIYWWYSRASPLFGSGFDMASGRDFMGNPIEGWGEYAAYIATRFEPIWAEQGLNWMVPGLSRDSEIPQDALTAALVIGGELLGLKIFPDSSWTDFYDTSKDPINAIPEEELDPKQVEAARAGKLDWSMLTEIQQMQLLTRHPDLNDLYEVAQSDSAVRDSDVWKQWTGRVDEEQVTYYDRGNDLVGRVQSGELDTRELRDEWSEAGQNYGVALQTIQKEPTYETIYDYFDQKESRGKKYGFRDSIALAEYREILFADFTDAKGDVDWDARDAAVDAFAEKWGEETYLRIREMYAQKKGIEGLDPALIRMADDKNELGRDFWQTPYQELSKMTEEDIAEGNVSPEHIGLVRQYLAAETDEDRELLIEANPLLDKDWRGDWRRDNPEDDARLALWGYSGKIQTMKAYELVTKWASELGLPLEQLGLGLPPRTLIENLFEQSKIVSDTSPSSWEVKLYNLENPQWLAWQIEQGIKTDDLSDESIDALRLKVANADMIRERDSWGNPASENFIPANETVTDPETGETVSKRQWTMDNQYATNPDFRDDQRRVEIYEWGVKNDLAVTPSMVEANVAHKILTDEFGGSHPKALLDLFDDKTGYYDMRTNIPAGKDGSLVSLEDRERPVGRTFERQVRIWRTKADDEYLTADAGYNAIPSDDIVGRFNYMTDNEGYRKQDRELEGLELNVPDSHIAGYVDYYEQARKGGYRGDRWLAANLKFYQQVWRNDDLMDNAAVDFTTIPDVQYDVLLEKWPEQIDLLENELVKQVEHIADATDRGIALRALKQQVFDAPGNGGLFEDYQLWRAYQKFVPVSEIPDIHARAKDYAGLLAIMWRGKPLGWDEWWEDDRYIKNHMGLYKLFRGQGWWTLDRDFSTVPTVEFERMWNEDYFFLRNADGSANDAARIQYRRDHDDFDAEGVRVGKFTKEVSGPRPIRFRRFVSGIRRFP